MDAQFAARDSSREAIHKEERLRFLQIEAADRTALADFRPILEKNVQHVLGKFYDHLARYPDLVGMFGGQAGIDRARAAQTRHWLGLFDGQFDASYFERVQLIGMAHERIGLEPRWYIGGYALAMGELVALAVDRYRRSPSRLAACLRAIVKALFLDMDLAVSIYNAEGKTRAVGTFQKRLGEFADTFEGSVKKVVEKVSTTAAEMRGTAQTMTSTAEETQRRSTAVASAAEQASANVQTVASATEELSSSIGEISRQVAQSSKIAAGAVTEADKANQMVRGLVEASQKIGAVVALITDIANQTNLLALNATIEAARAGEAGKGFAVVAAEVKNLANQTAKATEEIGTQISGVQGATEGAVKAIQAIGTTIGEINSIAAAIAAAMEQQSAATKEIARNVQQAAVGTSEVTENISGVTKTATDTGTAAGAMLQVSDSLARDSNTLHGEVNAFMHKIRAA